jgi:hypothetical protein
MPKLAVCFTLLLLPVFAAAAPPQEGTSKPADSAARSDAAKPAAHFYRLDYALEELDESGKPVNSRSFSIIVSTAGTRSGTFVVGSKVPLVTGAESPKSDTNKFSTQFQYIDIGVKITANDIHEDGDRLAFNLNAEVSSLASPVTLEGVSEPVLRQNEWRADVLIPIGKATPVYKSDSLDNKGSMQLILTATRVE